MDLAPGKFFAKFLAETKDMTPEQRAAAVTIIIATKYSDNDPLRSMYMNIVGSQHRY
jgi:hypothetical protein